MEKEIVLTASSGPFWRGLLLRNCRIFELNISGEVIRRIVFPSGTNWLTTKNISYPFSSAKTHALVNNKYATYELCRASGIKIPHTILLKPGDTQPADVDYMNTIVKPNDGYGSKGLSLTMVSHYDLENALKLAASNDSKRHALIQQRVKYKEYRFTVLNGRVESVLLKQPAAVYGDGLKNVRELIAEENKNRLNVNIGRLHIQYPQLSEDNMVNLSVDMLYYIPQKSEEVVLGQSSLVRDGASVYELIDSITPIYIKIAEQIACLVGSSLLAVDMFIKDVSNSTGSDYFFNEANCSPALRMYYASRNKDMSWLADKIIDQLVAMTEKEGKQ